MEDEMNISGQRTGTITTLEERFWLKVHICPEGCWEWLAHRNWGGYGKFSVNTKGKIKSHFAHRMSWELTFGAIPTGLWVLHHCDNRCCVRPDHLFLGTRIDNMRDAMEKGRFPVGMKSKKCKLTDEQVRHILRNDSGLSVIAEAKKYGISRTHMYGLRKRQRRLYVEV
jgi:hypothetical protein